MRGVKVLAFDTGGTILDWHGGLVAALIPLYLPAPGPVARETSRATGVVRALVPYMPRVEAC